MTTRKKKSKRTADIEYSGVSIKYTQHTDVTHEADPEDEWDRDDLQHEIYIDGYQVKDQYPDVLCPFKIDTACEYYLVAATYGTGDSFHHESGLKSYVGLYKTQEEAEHACKLVQAHYDIYKYENHHYFGGTKKIENPANYEDHALVIPNNGVNMRVDVDWTGYFESLVSVDTYIVRSLSMDYKHENNI